MAVSLGSELGLSPFLQWTCANVVKKWWVWWNIFPEKSDVNWRDCCCKNDTEIIVLKATGWLKIEYPTGEYTISPWPVVWFLKFLKLLNPDTSLSLKVYSVSTAPQLYNHTTMSNIYYENYSFSQGIFFCNTWISMTSLAKRDVINSSK